MVYEKKNKTKKKYICPNCLKDFGNLKYQLELHLNRINPCKKINLNNDVDNNIDNNHIIINNNNNINDINDCKTKIEEINLDSKQFFNDNNVILEFMKKIDYLIKQNEKINNDILNLNNEIEELKEDNKTLKEDNEKIKNQVMLFNETPKNTTNFTLNMNFQINNFNDTKDFKGNFNNLLKEQGKNIYLKTIENMYLNPTKPENHNIYIADKNRGYAKIYNNGRWETKNINIIDTILNNVVDYYKISLEKIKEDQEKYEKLKNQINAKIQYLNFCDLEFLEDLEDEQLNEDINNKAKIKRCIDFREMVYKDIINLFHDKKDIVINTHKKYKSNISLT